MIRYKILIVLINDYLLECVDPKLNKNKCIKCSKYYYRIDSIILGTIMSKKIYLFGLLMAYVCGYSSITIAESTNDAGFCQELTKSAATYYDMVKAFSSTLANYCDGQKISSDECKDFKALFYRASTCYPKAKEEALKDDSHQSEFCAGLKKDASTLKKAIHAFALMVQEYCQDEKDNGTQCTYFKKLFNKAMKCYR